MTDCLQNANWLVEKPRSARPDHPQGGDRDRQASRTCSWPSASSTSSRLTCATVADAIQMHESTVSRVTSNKYMLTAARPVRNEIFLHRRDCRRPAAEDAHSAEAVRYRIRQLIEVERADDVLSDDAIVDVLRGAGVDIARRTVAKYREAMHIPSSVQRRREKRAFPARQAS